jgi:hypothetical protein
MAQNPRIRLDSADRTHNARGCPPLILIEVIVAHHEPGARQLGTKKTFPDLTQPVAGLGNLSLTLVSTASGLCHPMLLNCHEPAVKLRLQAPSPFSLSFRLSYPFVTTQPRGI